MAITQAEVAASGISSGDFTAIANAKAGFLKSLTIQQYNPTFTLHDNIGARNPILQFSAATDSTSVIVRAYNNGGTIYTEVLPIESDSPGSPSSWTTPYNTGTGLASTNVKIVWQGSQFDLFFVQTNGKVARASSTTGASGTWTTTDFSSTALPVDGTLEWIAYGGGVETIYFVTKTDVSSHWIRAIDTSGSIANNSYIYWHDSINGFDCEKITDPTEDTTGGISNASVRHILTVGAPMPGFWTESTDSSGNPIKKSTNAGGIISFVIRPVLSGNHGLMTGQRQIVHAFDNTTALQYRSTAHVTPMDSIFSSDGRDILWAACIGGDGDHNTTDVDFGYTALYYYSSRDGIFWSQDKLVPLDGLGVDFSQFASGIQLIKLGHYAYILSANTTLRSLLTAEFGSTVHPNLTLDISPYVLTYSSSASDVRQSNIVIDNRNGYFNNTIIGSPGQFTLITKIGKKVGATSWQFQTSIEDIDSVSPDRERPSEKLQITSRDRMSWLVDRTQSADAVMYDNQFAGMDLFQPLGTAQDAGMAHTAVVKGTFTAKNNNLHLTSRYQEGISFNTFETTVADGAIESTFILPDPASRDLTTSPLNGTTAPTYGGVIYRAVDRDNFWWVKYDYWLEEVAIGYRVSGVDIGLFTLAPSGWFISQANNELPVTIRCEFRHSYLKVFTKESDSKFHLLWNQLLPGASISLSPVMQGYVGVFGSAWSDEDQAPAEPDPIAIVLPGDDLIDLSPFGDVGTSDPTAPAPYPPGDVIKSAGENVFAGSSSHSDWLKNFISLTTPQYNDNTPGTFTGWAIQAVLTKPNPTLSSVGGYVLAYNSGTTKSAVWYAPNIWAITPTWSKGADQDGKYSVIRAADTLNTVLISSPSQPGGFSTVTVGETTVGGGHGIGHGYSGVVHVGDTHTYDSDPWSFFCTPRNTICLVYSPAVDLSLTFSPSDYAGSCTSWTTQLNGSDDTSHPPLPTLSGVNDVYWDDRVAPISVTVTVTHIYGGGGESIKYSSDNGATFGSPLAVGDTVGSPLLAGFDVTRASPTSYASCYGKVRKATTLGGAYSDFVAFSGASPVCVIIPYFRRNNDTSDQTAAANPDFLAALNVADSGGGTLYWVDGTTGTKHNITPIAGITFDNPNCITTHYGTHIAVFGKVSGVYKMYISENAGVSWTFVRNLTSPTFIRGRRSNSHLGRGQIYLADNGSMWYSSHWGESNMFIRNMPGVITTFDTVW